MRQSEKIKYILTTELTEDELKKCNSLFIFEQTDRYEVMV